MQRSTGYNPLRPTITASAYAPTPYAPTPYTDEPLNKLKIVLTFDDGPASTEASGSYNRTQHVMTELEDRGITGVFFVQTHVPIRGGSREGRRIMGDTNNRGHILAVHTTVATNAHRPESSHRNLQADKDFDFGASLQRGIDQIERATETKDENDVVVEEGVVVEFVRPPNGDIGEPGSDIRREVVRTYESKDLELVLWDIDPERFINSKIHDNVEKRKDKVLEDIPNRMREYLPDLTDPNLEAPSAVAKTQMVALFHDVQQHVAENIGTFIDKIEKVARDLGYTPCLNLTPDEVKQVMIDQNTENEDVR